jgi:thiamine-phosphate pyrophosphorylase
MLKRLALIADGFTDAARAARAVAAVRAGVRWVHLRDHAAAPDAFEAAARTLTTRLRTMAPDVQVSVNTHLADARLLRTGLHLGRRGPTPAAARAHLGGEALVGYSAHQQVEAEGERVRHVDYFFFSPVFPTTSKPDHPGIGLAALERFCRASRVPVLALGGVTPERVVACRRAGAHGVAVLSGIMAAPAPAAAARAYLRALVAPVR